MSKETIHFSPKSYSRSSSIQTKKPSVGGGGGGGMDHIFWNNTMSKEAKHFLHLLAPMTLIVRMIRSGFFIFLQSKLDIGENSQFEVLH